MSSKITTTISGFCLLVAALSVSGSPNEYDLRDPGVGSVPGLDVFTPRFNCPGKHLSKVTFTSFTPANGFAPIPWLSVPRIVEYDPADQMPSVEVDLNLEKLPPGRHAGIVSLECVTCEQQACVGQTLASPVSVVIPHPTTFGASAADAQFGGLVNGQPVSANDLLHNVLNDVKNSSFGQLPSAQSIFTTLEDHYFENNLSDVTFVRTVDDNNATTGRLGTKVVAVYENDPGPGEGAYTVNQIGGEEIFIGVDTSMKGIHEARQNPTDYYVFMLGEDMAVIKKADLVHLLVHEGMHAAIGGQHNVAKPSGGSGAPIEEEVEAFLAGNAAAQALGLPPDPTVPKPGGYDAGSNPAYPPLFPSLAPGAGGNAPAAAPAAGTTPAGGATPAPAPSGDDDAGRGTRTSGLLPADIGVPAPGFCTNEGSGLRCDGAPNYALACDDANSGDAECSLAQNGLPEPCSLDGGSWLCGELPPAVVRCTQYECGYDPNPAEVCTEDGNRYACSEMPAFGLSCKSGAGCSLALPPSPDVVECEAGACGEDNAEPSPVADEPVLYAATQNLDCGMAGAGVPMPLRKQRGRLVDSPIFFPRAVEHPGADRGGLSMEDMLANLDVGYDWFGGADWEFARQHRSSDSGSGNAVFESDLERAISGDTRFTLPEIPNDALDDPYEVMIFPFGRVSRSEWVADGRRDTGAGADRGPAKGIIQAPLRGANGFGFFGEAYLIEGRSFDSLNFQTPAAGIPAVVEPYVNQRISIGSISYTSILFEAHEHRIVVDVLVAAGIDNFERNACRVVLLPEDPHYVRTARHGGNSWGGREDDQWAIKRVGFTDDETSAWNLVSESAEPVVVAVIDTGLDWDHLDISPENIWRNDAEHPGNGVDDDMNGYVDDVSGWNFLANDNRPSDFDGHGTVVAGIIAAAHNDVGIAGINPNAKIMVLKAVNNFGTTRASYLAEAIVYAVDNGARVINISVGGATASRMEQAAIDFAREHGVLVVAASGNDGIELDDFGPGGYDNALTVGATHVDDRAAAFSNFGEKVDLAAPGVDVLSLRARYTDANYRPGVAGNGEYSIGDNFVGNDKRYLRVSGTSFSTPIVAGIASLLMSNDPGLTAADVERILAQTATDIDFPGKDNYTGHGMVNARAALGVGPDFSIVAEITGLVAEPPEAPEFIRVQGTIGADAFKRAWMQIGPGENPAGWRYVGQKRKYPITDGTLGTIPINEFGGGDLWQIVINVEHENGVVKRAAYPVRIR